MLPYPPYDDDIEYPHDDSEPWQCSLYKGDFQFSKYPNFAFAEKSMEYFCSECADFLRRAGF